MKKFHLLLTGIMLMSLAQAQLSRISSIELTPGYLHYGAAGNILKNGIFCVANVNTLDALNNYMYHIDSTHQLLWCKAALFNGSNNTDSIYIYGNTAIDDDIIYQSYATRDKIAIVAMDHNGNLLWNKASPLGGKLYAKNGFLYMSAINVLSYTYPSVVKFDSNGNIVWKKNLDFAIGANILDIKADDDGNVYLYGNVTYGFFNMMLHADGSVGYFNRFMNNLNEQGELTYGVPIGNNRSMVLGHIFNYENDSQTYFYGITDSIGIISNLTAINNRPSTFETTDMQETENNSVFITVKANDTIYPYYYRNLFYEIDFEGNILSLKSRIIVDEWTQNIRDVNNNITHFLSGLENKARIYTTPRSMDGCFTHTDMLPDTFTFDISDLEVFHNVTVVNNSVNFSPLNITIGDVDYITVAETCVSQIGIEENPIAYQLYPNPADEFIMLESEEEIDRIEILTLDGKIVKNVVANSTVFSVDVSNLATGIYFIRAFAGTQSSVQKFMKH